MKSFDKTVRIIFRGILPILYSGILVINIISRFYPDSGRVGVIFWIGLICWYAFYAGRDFLALLRYSVRSRDILFAFVFSGLICLTIFHINRPENLSGETTQITTCALRAFLSDPGWGYNGLCFLEYPIRQYLVAGLPSLLFGRSLQALYVGGLIYFFIGLFIFFGAVLSRLGNSRQTGVFLSFTILVFFNMATLQEYLFYFEQSIYPVAFGLAGAGFVIRFLNRKDPVYLWAIAGIILISGYIYTPALSLVIYGTGILLFVTAEKNISRRERILAVVLLVVSLVSSFAVISFRRDLRLISPADRSGIHLAEDVSLAFRHIMTGSQGKPFLYPVLAVPLVGFVIALIIIVRTPASVATGLWVTATVIIAVISKGYSYYGVDLRLLRASVVIPVILVWFMEICRTMILHTRVMISVIVLILLFISAYWTHNTYILSRETPIHYSLFQILPGKSKNSKSTGTLILLGKAATTFLSLKDTFQYFRPDLSLSHLPENTCVQEISPGDIVVYSDHPDCPELPYFYQGSQQLNYIGSIVDKTNEFIVYESQLVLTE